MITSEEVLAIDLELSTRVRNFHKMGNYQWKFSCTICGDSKRDLRKARFFIGESQNTLMCHCHNCQWSGSLKTYLQIEHPDLYTKLQQQKFIAEENTLFSHDALVETLPDNVLKHIFYIPKSKNVNSWVNKLKSKKVTLKRKNFDKLLLLYKHFHNPAQSKET